MPLITDSPEAFDRRLGKARDLLDTRHHRARNGVVSLMALVAAGVSATLLFTLVFGTEEAPAQAKTKTEATPAAFELSASELSASATEPTTPSKPAQPMLVATEK
jgi:hypothetical protein